jgi:hypothetical protein
MAVTEGNPVKSVWLRPLAGSRAPFDLSSQLQCNRSLIPKRLKALSYSP